VQAKVSKATGQIGKDKFAEVGVCGAGKNRCSREAANELKAYFGALRRTAHVSEDLRGNIAVAPGNSGSGRLQGRMLAPLDTRLRA
jgi:hypothetical protein